MQISIDGGNTYVEVDTLYIEWPVYVDNEDEDPERRDDVAALVRMKATDEGITANVDVDGYIDSTLSMTAQEFADKMANKNKIKE